MAKSAQLQIRVTTRQKAMIRRLAQSAGRDVSAFVLARVLSDQAASFAGIVRALSGQENRRFALAELNDFLTTLAPAEFSDAVRGADLRHLSPLVSNYVAAMVEQAAMQKGVPAPTWVREVPPLDVPHFAASLPGLRLHLLRASPVAFKRRNLFVDASVGQRV